MSRSQKQSSEFQEDYGLFKKFAHILLIGLITIYGICIKKQL